MRSRLAFMVVIAFVGALSSLVSWIVSDDLVSSIFHYLQGLLAVTFLIFLVLVLLAIPRVASQSRNSESHPAYSAALSHVDKLLDFLGLLLPSRIMKEDAGDAREVINKLAADSAPTWMIYTKLTSSVFWILLAAVREVLTVTKKKPS